MGKILILSEKPSAARNFAKALGGMSGTYDGQPYEITNAIGHLLSLPKKVSDMVHEDLKEKYDSWVTKQLR